MSQFREVLDWVRKERLTLFLGAGFSLKAGAPGCRDLINAIFESVPEKERDGVNKNSLDEISQQFEDNYGRNQLIDILRLLFQFERKDMSDHESLSHIPHIRRIFTTNYDTLLEETYGDSGVVIKRNEDISKHDEGKTTIYKVHGDLEDPDNMILTKKDYVKFYTKQPNTLIWDVLKGTIATGPLLFIGYSLDDSNLGYLLERLVTESRGNNYPVYLIAPGLPTVKRKQLERKKIKYIDAKAEDFFRDLFIDMDKNIFKDWRKKKVSDKTFHAYCKYRKLDVDLLSKSQRNEIAGIKALNDALPEIKLRVKGPMANIMMKSGENYNSQWDCEGVSIPAYKFPSEVIDDFSVVLNGVRIRDKEDISNIMVAPVHKKIHSIIVSRAIGFREKADIIIYKEDQRATAVIKGVGYKLSMTFRIKDQNIFNVTLKVDFEDEFDDLSGARKWMDLLVALWRGEEVQFSQLFDPQSSFSIINPDPQLEETDFDDRVRYLENLKIIEERLDTLFINYETFTPQKYKNSKKVRSYLTGDAYTHEIKEDRILSFEVALSTDEKEKDWEMGNRNFSLGIVSEIDETVEFNGRILRIPYRHTIYRNCEIKEKTRLDNGNYSMKIKLKGSTVTRWYSEAIHPSFRQIETAEKDPTLLTAPSSLLPLNDLPSSAMT